MRVLHLSSERSWKGGEQQIAYLVEESSKHGIECHVAARRGSAFEEFCSRKGYPLSLRTAPNPLSVRTVASFCRHHTIDIVHMHSGGSHSLGVLAKSFGAPSRLILSRRIDKPLKRSWFTRWKYNHAGLDAIACVSDRVKEIIAGDIRDQGKLVTIYDGIDCSKFDPTAAGNTLRTEFGIPADCLLVGNTSALFGHKDYPTFIDTVDCLIRKGLKARYLIIGEGPLREPLEKYMRQKGLEEDLIFAGFRKDVARILPELDIFLMTSSTEGLGSSVLDAYACRVPVVSTAGGGLPEIVKHRETGLLCPVKQPEELANAVLELAGDTDLRARLVASAAAFVGEFTKEKMAERYSELYRTVLQRTRDHAA